MFAEEKYKMTGHVTQRRARVFISCGQNKKTNEVTIAGQIRERLEKLGFDPYIAVEEQTLRGLKENIFRQLSTSEYFLFVDFKREKLENENVHRGSLFSHQELALASYLDIEVLAFREAGIKAEDGIMGFLQANAISFAEADRHLLPDLIESRARMWDPNWRNEIVLKRDVGQYTDAHVRNLNNRLGRYFQIGVKNLHKEKVATNCYAYLEKAIKLDHLNEIPLNTVELKWEGYLFPNAHILPNTTRRFDALRVMHDNPTDPQFIIFSDYTGFDPPIRGEGRYELRYVVVADNFPPARGTFNLKLSSSLCSTRLKQL